MEVDEDTCARAHTHTQSLVAFDPSLHNFEAWCELASLEIANGIFRRQKLC